jgi:aryl-alcohol dehydrogenase-like predicted oxidoreductase
VRTRTLGWTGVELTTIGLGTWAMGGSGWQFSWGPQDDVHSVGAIHRALEGGINWIDTAPAYGLGHSEEIVGKAVRGIAEKPFIATKCSRVWDERGTLGSCLKAESIQREAEASLRRLQVEVIDLYQIHWAMPDEDLEEGWTAVADLVRQGKVRYGGVSNFSVAQLERVRKIHPIASVQPPYSMLVRGIEQDLLAYCAAHRIGVVCYSPMYKGLLTGRFNRERLQSLAEDDHRRRDPRFQEPQVSVNLRLVESLGPLAQRAGRTLGELAIAWVLRRPEVTSAIVGARSAAQVDEFAAAGDWSLPAEIDSQIEGLLAQSA